MPMKWLPKVKVSKEEAVRFGKIGTDLISDKFEKFRAKFSNIA